MPGYYSHIAQFLRATEAGGSTSKANSEGTAAVDDGGWEQVQSEEALGAVGEMSVTELRAQLRRRKVPHDACREKSELVALLEETVKAS